MKREVLNRDTIIIRGRDEHAKHSKELTDTIAALKTKAMQSTSELEVLYEKKLAKERHELQVGLMCIVHRHVLLSIEALY